MVVVAFDMVVERVVGSVAAMEGTVAVLYCWIFCINPAIITVLLSEGGGSRSPSFG